MSKTIHSHLKKIPKPLIIILSVVLIFLLLNIGFRIYAAMHLKQQTINNELPSVAIITAKSIGGTEQFILPGNVKAWHEATIYARTNGYIKKWYVDIGSKVKKGDLLALIETPELDAQLKQAQADLNTAIANNKLAQITSKRWRNLVKTQSVSQQEVDEKVNNAAALEALVIAAQANVNRLTQLVNFERVIAPFDGIITARHTDLGALIDQGSTGNVPLFEIAQINPLRVYVKIPQNYSSSITPKMTVRLKFAEHPGKEFSAQLIETAHAIDPQTRTLLAQFKVNNDRELLLSGGYTEVLFTLKMPPNAIRIPVEALLFQAAGMQVAILDKNNRVQLRSINITRDFGDEVEIRTGVKPGEKVILYPPDSVLNGEEVRVSP
ncbi:efflux RND transporter periplasmic adaptor subunit [Legionella sp. km772]|uniref:efflux RND transporter periplasmic adaptor subunit n=1 Tax=Legionella sp. km772 TaxID=2498111 RepID=UPI000F8EBFFF|nr:efflux RND transporter periplasmic adaptor subunit [Legionella sp. km772]RUR06441.1 efflux RND transporter periplasmic adaptor subunit [Legionella sp. km772]